MSNAPSSTTSYEAALNEAVAAFFRPLGVGLAVSGQSVPPSGHRAIPNRHDSPRTGPGPSPTPGEGFPPSSNLRADSAADTVSVKDAMAWGGGGLSAPLRRAGEGLRVAMPLVRSTRLRAWIGRTEPDEPPVTSGPRYRSPAELRRLDREAKARLAAQGIG